MPRASNGKHGLLLPGLACALLLFAPILLLTPVLLLTPGCGERASTSSSRPSGPWVDVAAEAGLDFLHVNGAYGKRWFPEVMGAGCAFFDYDGDGAQDVLFVNSTYWSERQRAQESVPDTMALFRGDGKGGFTDVSEQTGMAIRFYGLGTAIADYDGDGDPDVLLTGIGGNRLMRNDGGRFVDVTDAAGVPGHDDDFNTSAGFFDADGDGDLDLFVCNYVLWSRELDNEIGFRIKDFGRVYGPPWTWEGRHCAFYRNNGDGTFRDDSEAAGVRVLDTEGKPAAKALGVLFVDYDRDGDQDVYVANDTVPNFLFRNRGDGTFEEVAAEMGLAVASDGRPTGAMGLDVGDLHNDGGLAIGVGNWSSEANSLFMMAPGRTSFMDRGRGHGIGMESVGLVTWGFFFLDYDLDGRLDAFQTNGGLEPEGHKLDPPLPYEQRSQLFHGVVEEGRGTFQEVPPEALGDLSRPVVARGAAYADVDGDGDVDILLAQVGARPLLLRNDQASGHHWLRVKLEGTGMNREAIGAVVELTVGGVTQRRFVGPTRSYCSQVELPVTFGLGTATKVEGLRVRWPDGAEQAVEVPGVDRLLVVTRQP